MSDKILKLRTTMMNQARRISKLIELNAPDILISMEINKFQKQMGKWHTEVINKLLVTLDEHRTRKGDNTNG